MDSNGSWQISEKDRMVRYLWVKTCTLCPMGCVACVGGTTCNVHIWVVEAFLLLKCFFIITCTTVVLNYVA